ncbi:MAG: hypothetical protein FD167_358 [bacterium]|nr:MAG: hypothetical protein FD167_358 [bacterium]
MLQDLKSPKLIHLKGCLFLFIGALCAVLIVAETANYKVTLLLIFCVWAFCRFYYYVFYVIEKYVDSQYKFSGLLAFLLYLINKKSNKS